MTLDGVREALARVLADLGADLRVEVERAEDGLTAFGLPDRGWHSTRLDSAGEAETLVAIADVLQNDISFWLPGGWGEALPPCPGHPHPMDARVLDEVAWWVCPGTGDRVGRVGRLAGSEL